MNFFKVRFDSIASKVLIVLSGNVISAALSFLMMFGAAKFLAPNYFGEFSLLLSYIAILEIVLNMGVSSALIGYVNRGTGAFLISRRLNLLCFSMIISISFCIVLIIAICIFTRVFSFPINYLPMILVVSFGMSLYSNFVAIAQSKQEWGKQNALIILNSFLRISFILVAYFYVNFINLKEDEAFNVILDSLLLYGLTIIAISVFFLLREEIYKFTFSINEARKAFTYIIPIAISNLVIILFMRVDALLIVYFLGVAELAKYSAANILGMSIPLITRALMNVSFSIASTKGNEYIGIIWKRQLKILPFIILATLLLILISPFVMNFLYLEKYPGTELVFFLLSLGYLWGIYIVPLESFFYATNPKRILVYKSSGLFFLCLFGPILIIYMGIFGAALSVFLAKLVSWTIIISDAYKHNSKLTN